MQVPLTANFVSISRVFAVFFLTSVMWADSPHVDTHLALGDSITFGLDPLLLITPGPLPSPDAFTGYPEIIARQLRLNRHKSLNAGCPGETSGSFLNVAAPDNGCNSPHVEPGFTFPPFKPTVGLHVAYTGSQIAYALETLKTNKKVDLITLSIGANDLLLVAQTCATAPDFALCAQQQLAAVVLPNYAQNLAHILTALRVQGKYKGKLVLLTLFAPDNQPVTQQAVQALNMVMRVVATPFGATFADGYGAFQQAAAPFNGDPCAAGLLGRNPDNTCGQHPSLRGQQVLANAILSDPTIN
ncbi:MAG: SGNH/GDSL hydrolase family protein [Bryobacterales bacterium]|nr:SGNH/GDSL hydrolase family protein [Bryobacterales bacterium]